MARNTLQTTRITTAGAGGVLEYVITHFVPSLQPLLQRYPTLFRLLGILLALWYCAPLSSIQRFWSQFSRFFIATIEVPIEEDLFYYLTEWIAEQRTLRPDITMYATSNKPAENSKRRRPDVDLDEANRRLRDDQVKYEQSQGVQIFAHNKRIFFLSRRAPTEGHTYFVNRSRRLEILSISSFGRSLQPIQKLIDQVYRMNREKERSMTVIRRPYIAPGGRVNWSRLTSKLPRDLNTVILDPEQKAAVLKDITEYMTDNTRNFYADHGIPYRRGYMFSGPPGTGKTSFCLALASRLHLDVYILTLLDHNIQDSDLMSLMNSLPAPSILLLEDIDTAGLSHRKQFVETTSTIDASTTSNTTSLPVQSGTVQSPDLIDDPDEDKQNTPSTKISLSGLLNAIDGVAAPEGHILIMTTNRPYDLDDAIARAGRVSVTVAFTNATRTQAKELFVRMYVDVPHVDEMSLSVDVSEEKTSTERLAQEFAEQIPEGQFSPADIQDYLLVHKRDAQRAVDGVRKWVSDKQAERKRRLEARQATRSRATQQAR